MTRSGLRRLVLAGPLPWLGGLLVLYLLLPLVALAAHVGGWRAGLRAPGLGSALWVSLLTATISAAACGLLGVPLAYVIARSHRRLMGVVGAVVLLPLALPPLMSGVLLVSVVGPTTFLGRAFGGHLTDSVVGIVLAQVFVAAPFVVVAARGAFTSIEPGVLDTAATLGWGEWQRFWRVSLRLAAPGIAAGLTLAWLRAFGEFGATVILAYHPYSLPVFTYVQFGASGISEAMAPSVLALAAAVLVLGLMQLRPMRVVRRGVQLRPGGSVQPLPAVGPMPAVRPFLGVSSAGSVHVSSAAGPGSEAVAPGTAPIALDIDHRLGSFRLKLAYASLTPHLAILGPSGAGKSVTLRALAGLYGPAAARVSLGERDLTHVPTERRHLGYLSQAPSLLPFQNVWEQVSSGKDADPSAASRWLARLGISELEHRLPDELSGGQQRRVALARALSRSPQLLLLDEPLSGLDAPVRDALRHELRAVLRDTGLASVIVTHDPDEAAMLAEEIVLMDDGHVLQAGPRGEVFSRPAAPLVAALLGIGNMCVGTMRSRARIDTAGTILEVEDAGIEPGMTVYWCVRSEKVTVDSGADLTGSGVHPGTVVDVIDLGRDLEVAVSIGDGLELWSRRSGGDGRQQEHDLKPGTSCVVGIPAGAVMVWPAASADRKPVLR